MKEEEKWWEELKTTKMEKSEFYMNCLDKVSPSSESWKCLFGHVSKWFLLLFFFILNILNQSSPLSLSIFLSSHSCPFLHFTFLFGLSISLSIYCLIHFLFSHFSSSVFFISSSISFKKASDAFLTQNKKQKIVIVKIFCCRKKPEKSFDVQKWSWYKVLSFDIWWWY